MNFINLWLNYLAIRWNIDFYSLNFLLTSWPKVFLTLFFRKVWDIFDILLNKVFNLWSISLYGLLLIRTNIIFSIAFKWLSWFCSLKTLWTFLEISRIWTFFQKFSSIIHWIWISFFLFFFLYLSFKLLFDNIDVHWLWNRIVITHAWNTFIGVELAVRRV